MPIMKQLINLHYQIKVFLKPKKKLFQHVLLFLYRTDLLHMVLLSQISKYTPQ